MVRDSNVVRSIVTNRRLLAVIALALLAGLAGCAAEPQPTTDKSPSVTGGEGGLSCVPIDQTALGDA
jgi:hypothetical protein